MGQQASVTQNISENNGFIFRTSECNNLDYTTEYCYRIIGKKVLQEKNIINKNKYSKKEYYILNFSPDELDLFIEEWNKIDKIYSSYNHPILSQIFNADKRHWINIKRDIFT